MRWKGPLRNTIFFLFCAMCGESSWFCFTPSPISSSCIRPFLHQGKERARPAIITDTDRHTKKTALPHLVSQKSRIQKESGKNRSHKQRDKPLFHAMLQKKTKKKKKTMMMMMMTTTTMMMMIQNHETEVKIKKIKIKSVRNERMEDGTN